MSAELRERILGACYKFLTPVARFLLKNSISYREFEYAARLAFVHVATREFGVRGRETNTSRVAALTGLPRKEITVLRSAGATSFDDPKKLMSPLADIVQKWVTGSAFRDSSGNPKHLQMVGPGSSFESLVRQCSSDLPIGAVQKELIRLGTAELDSKGLLALKTPSLIPESFDGRVIASLSFSLRALAETIANNSQPGSRRRIERFIESPIIGSDDMLQLRGHVEARLEELTAELATLLHSVAPVNEGARGRVGVGFYCSEESDE